MWEVWTEPHLQTAHATNSSQLCIQCEFSVPICLSFFGIVVPFGVTVNKVMMLKTTLFPIYTKESAISQLLNKTVSRISGSWLQLSTDAIKSPPRSNKEKSAAQQLQGYEYQQASDLRSQIEIANQKWTLASYCSGQGQFDFALIQKRYLNQWGGLLIPIYLHFQPSFDDLAMPWESKKIGKNIRRKGSCPKSKYAITVWKTAMENKTKEEEEEPQSPLWPWWTLCIKLV